MEHAREAYDAFLARYPYCYGYWRKYADFEKRKGSREHCEQVSFIISLHAINQNFEVVLHLHNDFNSELPGFKSNYQFFGVRVYNLLQLFARATWHLQTMTNMLTVTPE